MPTAGSIGGSADFPVAAAHPASPPRPPERETDVLGGMLTATVFPTVKPHRQRVMDILAVIGGTQIGRELLHDFGRLAARGHVPSIDILDPRDALTQQAARQHCLLLSQEVLTGGARTIGVSPELEHAPWVLFRLTEIRNTLALREQGGHFRNPSDEPLLVRMDPIMTRARFQGEVHQRTPARPGAGAGGQDADAVSPAAMRPAPPPLPPRPAQPPGPPPAAQAPSLPPRPSRDHAAPAPSLLIPSSKPSTAPHPYGPVTENGGAAVHEPGAGRVRRTFRWVECQARRCADFLLRRRGTPRDDRYGQAGAPIPHRKAGAGIALDAGVSSPASTLAAVPFVTSTGVAAPDSTATAIATSVSGPISTPTPASIPRRGSGAASDATDADRPLIKQAREGQKPTRHKRTRSIWNADPARTDNGGSRAGTTHTPS